MGVTNKDTRKYPEMIKGLSGIHVMFIALANLISTCTCIKQTDHYQIDWFKASVTNDLLCGILLSLILILVLDGCYFQTSKIITKSTGIIRQKKMPAKDFANFWRNHYIFIFYLPYNIRLFLLLFSVYYLALFSFYL